MWPRRRPTSEPSGILIHPTVWPQLCGTIHRRYRQTGAQGEPLQRFAQKWHVQTSHVRCSRGSVPVWQKRNMLSTSDFVDDVIFGKATLIGHVLNVNYQGAAPEAKSWCLRLSCLQFQIKFCFSAETWSTRFSSYLAPPGAGAPPFHPFPLVHSLPHLLLSFTFPPFLFSFALRIFFFCPPLPFLPE